MSFAQIAPQLMSRLMADYGLTREQAAGFVGNLAHESAGFRTLQEVSPLVKGSRGGYGYAQWTGPRRRAFEGWASQRGLDMTTLDTNYGFLRHELDNTPEGSFLPRLKSARTVEEASRAVEKGFLRPGIPHSESRVKWAYRALGGEAPPQTGMGGPSYAMAVSANAQNVNQNNGALPKADGFRPEPGTSATPPTTVANLLGVDKPRVIALLAALSEQGNEQQQQQVDPRQMFERNYAWARANGWRV